MSKIARNPVPVPSGVTVELSGQDVKVKGPKGELSARAHDDVEVVLEEIEGEKIVRVKPRSETRQARALWGTWRSHLNNMVIGVNEMFTKTLVLQGVGYRANMQGSTLVLQLGFSHDVHYPIPEGITAELDGQTIIKLSGIDKQKVGQVAAEIRAFRPPEPYKGKGVRYEDEEIVRKEGKKK